MGNIIIAMPEMGNSLFRKYMKSKYIASLERAGAKVKIIPLEDADAAAKQAVKCDGLLLPGGADINPALYGQSPSEKCGKPNAVRDGAEPKILNEFLKTGKPVLAICRGIQLLNVCLGGTLIQDIKDTQKSKHMDFLSRAHSCHKIAVTKGTKLFDIFKEEEVKVNSLHHQVIDRLGKNLTVSAVSDDGFIEAVELSDYGWCIGVQWHPEHMSRKSRQQQAIFDAFVKEVSED